MKTPNKDSRSSRRGRYIVNRMVDCICEIVCPTSEKLPSSYVNVESFLNILEKGFKACASIVTQLYIFGNRLSRITAGSILATPFELREVQNLLGATYSSLSEDNNAANLQLRSKLGKERFTSLRKTYSLISAGNDIPKYNYTFRVDSRKIWTVLSFLQSSLCVKPGVVRDVTVADHRFTNMPLYERGGKSVERLFEAYKSVHPENQRIGRILFIDIVKLLTKRGESKAGLSTYYINLRYASSVFKQMQFRSTNFDINNHDQTN